MSQIQVDDATHAPGAATSEHSDSLRASATTPRVMFSRLVLSCLFWSLCLTLSAGGHRFYKAIVGLDRAVSQNTYRGNGARLVWVGHGPVEDAYQRILGAARPEPAKQLYALPNSGFWLTTAIALTSLGGLMAWAGRWIPNNAVQSLIGLFSGHVLWLGAIELGLDAAGRNLGLAASLELVDGRAAGTHAAGCLIRLSVVFLVPILIGLTMHESNRCAMFRWFRARLPIGPGRSPGGVIENYAARTAVQFFMTVWFCYVSVLWLATAGRIGEIGLLLTLVAIVAATPYMVWRTACQPGHGGALRYSVSGAVVTWTAVEIAASMHLISEPWLSNSWVSGTAFLGLSAVLTGLTARYLLSAGPGASVSSRYGFALIAALCVGIMGCTKSETSPPTADAIAQRLVRYDAQIETPRSTAAYALQRALGSGDAEMRAQAAIAFGKTGRVGSVVRDRLRQMAGSDDSRLAQFAALTALHRLELLSPELERLLRQLCEDQEWGRVARQIGG